MPSPPIRGKDIQSDAQKERIRRRTAQPRFANRTFESLLPMTAGKLSEKDQLLKEVAIRLGLIQDSEDES